MEEVIEIDYDAAASALGVPRETLPSPGVKKSEAKKPSPVEKLVGDYALSDSEWEIFRPHFPTGCIPRSLNDRGFLDGVIWRNRARGMGKSWWYVPPECGNRASMRGRFARWCEWGWWDALNSALQAEPGLSDRRKADFASIAAEAAERRERLLAGRKSER